jgi:hypothetical protein
MMPPKYARQRCREVNSDVGSIPTGSTMRGRPGFDGFKELQFRAGNGAHRNESQTATATPYELPMAA